MANNELQEQELQSIIEQSVDDAVKRAFKKYGRVSWRSLLSPRRLLSFLVILAVLGSGIWLYERNRANEPVAPVEDHDLTLENDGIFGFKAADFEEPILGEATRQRQLIAEEQEVYVNTTITDTGLFNLGVFNKQQALTIHGTGQYTIDRLSRSDISLNEQTYELTIRIPHAELHDTIFDPAQTEIGDTKNGWLAFGSIKLDAEQQTYRSEMEASTDKRKIFDIAHQHDEKMRDMIDGLFEKPVCAALFGSMNVYALADGLPVWANLMLAILDQVDATMTREKLRTNPRIQKYTERWAKK